MSKFDEMRVPSSYRDPRGHVYEIDGKIYRTVSEYGIEDFEAVRKSGLYDDLVAQKLLLPMEELTDFDSSQFQERPQKVLAHPRIAFISYPYEWTFSALKAAAMLHLDIQIRALDKDVVLSDASAFNIQFQGFRPVFIDHLSFRPYKSGEYWLAHRQFCEQFLNPLVLQSYTDVSYNAWYRGNLEGLPVTDIAALLPWKACLSFQVLTNIIWAARLEGENRNNSEVSSQLNKKPLPKQAYLAMLNSLRAFIAKLEINKKGKTVWEDYAQNNSYAQNEAEIKKSYVADFVKECKPDMVWDMGCNTGEYSQVALDSGAAQVIGFEYDSGALELSYKRSVDKQLAFLPLYLNAANPSPSQGWMQNERDGLSKRYVADALIALAVIHHLCIARNIPLPQVLQWMVEMAPVGIIEFIPKTDPMVQELIKLREDIFFAYSEENFDKALSSIAKIDDVKTVTASGRKLYRYSRL